MLAIIERSEAEKYFYGRNKSTMIALFLVLAISLIVAVIFLGGFIWSVRRDQFEDNTGAAMRMLFDNDTDNKKL